MRFSWLAAPLTASVILAVMSCGSFSEQPAEADASDEGSVSRADAASEAESEAEGGERDGGDHLALPCPPASGGTSLPTAWVRRALFDPTGLDQRMYPFAIATDTLHVTWLAQVGAPDAGNDIAPYNGNGSAMVLRAAKSGAGKPAVVARDQPLATALALDGTDVYWTTYANAVATLQRQDRDVDCNVTCPPPASVVTFPPGVRIVRLLRAAPKVLFALAQGGKVFRVALGTVPAEAAESGTYPAFTATSTDLYVSAGLGSSVHRVPVDGGPEDPTYLLIPPAPDAGAGVSPIATDCDTLWMTRNLGSARSIFGHAFSAPGSYTQLASLGAVDVFDLGADARFVYAAAANGGGLIAVDKISKGVLQLYAGNFFALAVDDDGVYFGEHAVGNSAGTMYMLEKK